jgi:riboflavin synthase
MFTGLVEATGRVALVEQRPAGRRVRIDTDIARDVRVGDSISVNGVCLTVTTQDERGLTADVGPETARITTLGGVAAGHVVNLERSMRADDRFGGHFVQGHVDGTGSVDAIRQDGDARWVTIGFPEMLAPYFIPKGAVTVDGISLTIAALHARQFEVMIIPHTWTATNLALRRVGDAVNLECDMIGKYVVRTLEVRRG